MSEVPSVFHQGKSSDLTQDNARIKWCMEEARCKNCKSLVTMQILAGDKPCMSKCMVCDEVYLYTENDLKELHLI